MVVLLPPAYKGVFNGCCSSGIMCGLLCIMFLILGMSISILVLFLPPPPMLR